MCASRSQVARQLPRSAAECGLVIYRIKYKKKHRHSKRDDADDADDADDGSSEEVSRLGRVRREVAREHLGFLSEHHQYFRGGLRSADGHCWLEPIEIDNASILSSVVFKIVVMSNEV